MNNNKITFQALKEPTSMENFGVNRVDDYFWMRLSDEQKNSDTPDDQTQSVLDFLNAENAYTESALKDTESLQNDLFEEIKGRIKQADVSLPYLKRGYFYYTRTLEDTEYYEYCRKKGSLEADEEIILDVNKMSEGYDFFSLGGLTISTDNKIAAYAVDTVSRRRYTVYFKNLETGELLEDKIENTSGNVVWANDNKTLFYTTLDPKTLRSDRIFRHTLGDDTKNDVEVFYEADETFNCGIYKTKSDNFLVVFSSQTLSTEARILPANNPTGEFKVFQPREVDHEYSLDHIGDKFIIRTNDDGAINNKIMIANEDCQSKDEWQIVVDHNKDILIESYDIFNDFLVVDEKVNGLTRLHVINRNSGDDHFINFGEEAYTAGISTNVACDTTKLRYSYSSLTTPSSVIEYDMITKDSEVLKEREVLGDFDKDNYETKRLWATAADGTKVPMSIVYKKGIVLDGSNPLLLYAYGSYGHNMEASFRTSILSILNRGFIYAIAHIRGGMEMGRQWYEDGKLLKKMNTFTDFNNCASYLIDEKYTSANKLFASGGSAGGLLMGAIANMRPELYKGIIAAVPFVDVVSTMLDATIPLTTYEYDEWGNPNEEEFFHYMLSYSPYDNVKKQDYPNILITTGYHDSQVQYWEPAKWVAKLRDMKTDNNILLLKTDMVTGHGGKSGRFESLKEIALEYAFMLDLYKK